MPPSSTRQRAVRIAICVMAVAVLPYLNALSGDFTFDDVDVIRNNPAVQHDPPARLLTTAYHPGALYRPVTMLTYAANARLSSGPFAYHAVNIITHALVTAGAYGLGRLLLASHTAAVVAAVLFAVHPCHTEAVTGIVGRAELLAALFVVLALLAFSTQLRTAGFARTVWAATALTALAIALLAKESAFTAIALVALLHHHLVPRAALRQRVRVVAPYLVLGTAYLALRVLVVGSLALPAPPDTLDNPLAHAVPAVRFATAVVVLWEYVVLLIIPSQLAADYSFNEIPLVLSGSDPRLLVAATALLTIGAFVAWNARRIPGLAMSAWLAIIPLALTANVLFPIGTIKAERLLYLPSLGACCVAAALCAHTLRRSTWGWRMALLLIVTTFATRTWARNYDWRDNLALFEATVVTSPNSAKAHYNMAVFLQRAGRLGEALRHYHRALDIYPAYTDAAFGIARVHELRGNTGAALHWYDTVLRRDWLLAKAHLNVGLIHQRDGAYTAAEAAFRSGLETDPSDPRLLVSLSAVRLSQGDRWGAQALLERLDRVPIPGADTVEVVAAARHEILEAIQ